MVKICKNCQIYFTNELSIWTCSGRRFSLVRKSQMLDSKKLLALSGILKVALCHYLTSNPKIVKMDKNGLKCVTLMKFDEDM